MDEERKIMENLSEYELKMIQEIRRLNFLSVIETIISQANAPNRPSIPDDQNNNNNITKN